MFGTPLEDGVNGQINAKRAQLRSCMCGSSFMDKNGCISHKLCLILSLSAHGAGAACGDVTVRASRISTASSALRAFPLLPLHVQISVSATVRISHNISRANHNVYLHSKSDAVHGPLLSCLVSWSSSVVRITQRRHDIERNES